jgi:hypothetical protein
MHQDSTKIFQQLVSLQETINDLHFQPDDVRRYFFDMQKGTLLNYYRGFYFLEIGKRVSENKAIQDNLNVSPNQIKLLNLTYTSTNSLNGYISYHNRNLVISSWSIFELLITALCDFILDDETKKELLSHELLDIKKSFKIQTLGRSDKKYIKKHLAHVPIPRKCDALYKRIDTNYSRDIKADKLFLRFVGDFRNTIHSNFIYYGSENKKYDFDDIEFVFEKNKVVRYSDPDEMGPTLYIKLVTRLIDVSLAICNDLHVSDMIPYPDLDAQD